MNERSGFVSAGRRMLWQYLTGKRRLSTLPSVIKIALRVAALALIVLAVVVLYVSVPAEGNFFNFPKGWNYEPEVIKWIDGIVDWLVVNLDPFFSAINIVVLQYILVPLEHFFLWLPWWVIIIFTGLISWRAVSVKFAWMAMGFLVVMSLMGLLDLGSMTLAITLASTLVCVVIGLPLGILAARSNLVNSVLSPILDAMQTMPCFVYLIPALMLFGLGKTPAVIATVIYALPPIIRLTSLGIRQVAPSLIEASRAFGATPWQLLLKVQVPLALPTILAGLNQTVMMALSMVVVGSMIGAKGLGVEVLNGIARLEVGRGIIAGTSVVFMAIILDRISQGFVKKAAGTTSITGQS